VPSTTGSSGNFRTLTTCPTCPTDADRTPSSDGTAPWRVGAFYTVGDLFNNVTFGLVGQRNERMPLYRSVPIGGAIGAAPPRLATNATTDTRTHWLATIAANKTLFDTQSGGAVGVLGDVFLPLGATKANPASADPPSPLGRAVRGAFRFLY
jgi:hypothetical protein